MLLRMIRHRKYLPYCFEALMELAFAKFCMVFFPFRRYIKKCGVPYCETVREDRPDARDEIIAIRCVLRVMPSYVPWRSRCLDQALAAQRMLARRRLQSTLYFGMAHEEAGLFIAHAWLRCGNHWIVGYQPHRAYRIVGTYAWLQ